MKTLRLFIASIVIAGLLAACTARRRAEQQHRQSLAQGCRRHPAAQDPGPRQDRRRSEYDVPMFGLLNPTSNKVEGFDVDIAKEIATAIFGNPDAIEYKEAVSKNRIPFLQDGTVDLVISTMTVNADREQQIDFSNVYYLAGQSLLVPKASAIASINDLAGKKVGTAKGSTSENNIRKIGAPGRRAALRRLR